MTDLCAEADESTEHFFYPPHCSDDFRKVENAQGSAFEGKSLTSLMLNIPDLQLLPPEICYEKGMFYIEM